MFTGLVQSLGTIDHIEAQQIQVSWHLTSGQTSREAAELGKVQHTSPFKDIAIGDSIAVDGICLTVTQILTQGFTAAVSPETLKRTTLGQLFPRSIVNLEASLRVGSKLGGHFVTGHIDGVGALQKAVRTADAWEMSICVPEAIARYIVEKGSVALNGISLTVANCSPSGDQFSVAVIPLTYSHTNLQFLQPQSPINIEADVLGKYVEKFLSVGRGAQDPAEAGLKADLRDGGWATSGPITAAFLAKHGYG
ncbi:MAG: riboflavin synthase [Elainellaceae cyanobacterium]